MINSDAAVALKEIGKSVVQCPVTLKNLYTNKTHKLFFCSGFEGYAEYKNLCFRPIMKIAFTEHF